MVLKSHPVGYNIWRMGIVVVCLLLLLPPFTPPSKLQLSVWNRSLLVLDSLLDQIQYFIALKILWIQSFHGIKSLPEGLGNLSSLQQLYIMNCRNLVHLPTEEAMRRLTQLKKLIIFNCPEFEDNERIKISHIPWVKINDQ